MNNKIDNNIYIDKKIYDKLKNKKDSLYSLSLISYLFKYNLNKIRYAFENNKELNLFIIDKKNNLFSKKVLSQHLIIHEREFLDCVLYYKENKKLSSEEILACNYLNSCLTQEFYENKNINNNINYYYNGEYHKYPFKEIYEKLKMASEEFKNYFTNSKLGIKLDDKEINYVLNAFLETLPLNDVHFTDNIINNYNYLKKSIKKVNCHKTFFDKSITPKYVKKAKVNEELLTSIISDIPKYFNEISIAFYIYLRMCNLLSYDEQFAILSSRDNHLLLANIHNNLDNLQNITINNNTVVCQEFIMIYAKALDCFGINYNVDGEKKYEYGHPVININYKNYNISVDPTIGVLNSDICFVKNGLKPRKFKIEAKDEYDIEEFNNSLNVVYDYIKNNYGIEYKSLKERFYQDDSIRMLSFNEKIAYLSKCINENNLSNIPKCFFVTNIARSLFLDDVDCTYIIEKHTESFTKNSIGIVLSIKIDNENLCYVYSNNKLVKYDKQTLKDKFDSKTIEKLHAHHIIKGLDSDNKSLDISKLGSKII